MARPSTLRNLGPRSDVMLAEVGIDSVADLKEVGAIEAYQRLKFVFGKSISLNALWAIHTGLQDRDWRSLSVDEKEKLKAELASFSKNRE